MQKNSQTYELDKKNNVNVNSFLTVFFYLTHVKRDDVEPIIQFLQKYNLNFSKIRKDKQIKASNFIKKNANYMAQSLEPVSAEQFQIIAEFLRSKTLVIAFDYNNKIWNISRTRSQDIPYKFDLTWSILNKIVF